VGGALNHIGGERFAAKVPDIDSFLFANFDRVQARRLSSHGMYAGRGHFDLLTVAEQTPEKPLCDGAATDVSGTNKEDAFHDLRAA
jgi:hypothetical protein